MNQFGATRIAKKIFNIARGPSGQACPVRQESRLLRCTVGHLLLPRRADGATAVVRPGHGVAERDAAAARRGARHRLLDRARLPRPAARRRPDRDAARALEPLRRRGAPGLPGLADGGRLERRARPDARFRGPLGDRPCARGPRIGRAASG